MKPKERLLSRIRDFVADLLFPRICVGCGKSGTYLCDSCLRSVPRRMSHECPFCETVTVPDGRTCPACAPRHSLDGIFSAVRFRDSATISEAIRILKYEYVRELATPLGQLLAEAVGRSELPVPDFLIPVPLHGLRFRYRGFNQSSLIADAVSESFMDGIRIPVRGDLLLRTRFTLPQARSRSRKARFENLENAFSVPRGNRREQISGKTIWIVDDVATTGTTLEECAKTLKRSGAKSVFGIVVAH